MLVEDEIIVHTRVVNALKHDNVTHDLRRHKCVLHFLIRNEIVEPILAELRNTAHLEEIGRLHVPSDAHFRLFSFGHFSLPRLNLRLADVVRILFHLAIACLLVLAPSSSVNDSLVLQLDHLLAVGRRSHGVHRLPVILTLHQLLSELTRSLWPLPAAHGLRRLLLCI